MLEFSQFNYAKDHKFSYSLACIAIPIIIVLIFLIPIHYYKYRDGARIESKYLSELYEGTKNKPLSKLYTFIFIIRRFITALVLVSMRDLNIWIRCIFFSIVQFFALVYAILIRPFDSTKDNIIEILNESIFSILCIIVTVCNKKSMWFKGLDNILIYTLMINGFLISFIVIIEMIATCIQKYKRKKNSKCAVHVINQSQKHENYRAPVDRTLVSIETKINQNKGFSNIDESYYNFNER